MVGLGIYFGGIADRTPQRMGCEGKNEIMADCQILDLSHSLTGNAIAKIVKRRKGMVSVSIARHLSGDAEHTA